MTKEEKQTFVLRISQANRTELIVIMQDILISYLQDAKKEKESKNEDGFINCLQLARYAVLELRKSLDRNNAVGKNIYPIYTFIDKEIAKGIIGRRMENLDEIIDIVSKLRNSFHEVSKEDHSGSMMSNTQTVYAGLTYGKDQLNENLWEASSKKRGFYV